MVNLAEMFARAMQRNQTVPLLPSVSEIDLRKRDIDDEAAEALAERIRCDEDGVFVALVLSDNRIGPVGAEALAGAVANSNKIISLDLGGNDVGDEGAKSFAEAIPTSSTIDRLVLCNNGITDRGVMALAESLCSNETVTQLDLSWNDVSVEGSKALADSLCCNKKLTNLCLTHNNIDDEGAEALANAIGENSVVHLDLSGNSIGQDGFKSFANALESNPHRIQLCFRDIRLAIKATGHSRCDTDVGLISRLAGVFFNPLGEQCRRNLLFSIHKAALTKIAQEALEVENQTKSLLLNRVGRKVGLSGLYHILQNLPDIFQCFQTQMQN